MRALAKRSASRAGIVLASTIAAAILFSIGCGDGRKPRVKTSGTVLIDGEPLTWGYVTILPQDGRAAGGQVGPDGRFSFTCYGDNDGAIAGTHTVIVSAGESLGPSTRKWHAPKKYANPETSGLTVTIDQPKDDLVIELTWDGGEVFVEQESPGKPDEPLDQAGEGLDL